MLFFISTFFTLRCPYDKPPKNHKNERNYTHISSDAPLEHNNARHRQTAGKGVQTKVISHRGYWKTEGSAQNSVTSFLKADSIGSYGSELDVWLTADSVLIANHDRVFKGLAMEISLSGRYSCDQTQ